MIFENIGFCTYTSAGSDEVIDNLIGLNSDVENTFLAFFVGKVDNDKS